MSVGDVGDDGDESEPADLSSDRAERAAVGALPTQFHIWGARGSRNALGSRVGNSTSCYSLVVGQDLYVFDGGSGLLRLSTALRTNARLMQVKRVHLFISHAHWDHWEGLKDAEWMWRKGNGLELTVLGPKEALDAIHRACEPPAFIQLEILALGTLASLAFVELHAGESYALPGARLESLALHHYSGIAPNQRYLDTLGYRLSIDGGPVVLYICDHEPTEDTFDMEKTAVSSADLSIFDASFGDIAEHAFGHGSIESVARLARSFPEARVLAAHHGPLRTDDELEAAVARHAPDLRRFGLAVEGATEQWDANARQFAALDTCAAS